MEVFRITSTKWSTKLQASRYPAQWNSKGKFIIYASSSRALVSLENIVHRSSEGLNMSCIQATNATLVKEFILSTGDIKSNRFLGLIFSFLSARFTSLQVMFSKLLFLGKYCLNSPL